MLFKEDLLTNIYSPPHIQLPMVCREEKPHLLSKEHELGPPSYRPALVNFIGVSCGVIMSYIAAMTERGAQLRSGGVIRLFIVPPGGTPDYSHALNYFTLVLTFLESFRN